ncbi:MAG: hypothetical protein N2319_02900 [Candidatus Kapabacteria bacterium]|nr:hypothetical protein [Candidatus Kapabacteria bacterium]
MNILKNKLSLAMNFRKYLLLIILIPVAGLILQSCDNYGEKLEFGKGELYYKAPVTKELANKLGNFLVESGFFGNENPVSVQLLKENDVYQFRMVVQEGKEKDESLTDVFKLFGSQISEAVLDGAKLEYHLCDKYFKTLKVIKI